MHVNFAQNYLKSFGEWNDVSKENKEKKCSLFSIKKIKSIQLWLSQNVT